MITFFVLCVAMMIAALALIARPLIKTRSASPTLWLVTPFVAILSLGIYWKVGHLEWERDQTQVKAETVSRKDLVDHIARLEQSLRENPNDVDATMKLVDALVQQDERSIAGRAGELVESVLVRQPDNPTALWYGAIGALSTGKLPVARVRLERILTLNPPDNIRSIIQRQIQDIAQQLGEQQAQSGQAAAGPKLNIEVSIPSGLAKEIDKSASLFVLARDPANAGPPLAAARRTAGELPLSMSLSDKDAMMAGRGISSVARVQVVARISKSGTPQAQAGDLFGEATVDIVGQKEIAVKISIDRKVEK